jgi:hypothetical protein
MSEFLPIEWEDKVNSPELLAFLQQFGNEHYLSAEEINQLRDALNEIGFPDKVIKAGEVNIASLTVSIIAGDFQWRLNKVEFLSPPAYSTAIDAATDEFIRKDIIEGDDEGNYHLKKGVEGEFIALEPAVTTGRIRLVGILIYGSTILDIIPPIVGDAYIPKAENESISSLQSGAINFIILETIQNKILLSGGATELRSINHWSNPFLFSGRDLYIKNDGVANCTIKHLYSGAGNYTFYFPNEVDFIHKPKELLHFKLRFTTTAHGIYEYVGVIASTAFTGTQDDVPDGTTYKQYSATEKAKLAAITGTNTGDETASSIVTKIGDGTKISSTYLPSYIDDVLEYANLAALPGTGESGKIYITIDSSKQYRWTGSAYLQITNGLIASTTDVPEGSNLYFNTARVLASLLTGISFATGGAIVSTDSVIIAFGKIQKQITDALTAIGLKADIASPTFTGTPAAPTATVGTNTTQLATTAFVQESKILPVTETGTSFSLTDAYNGKVVILTASCTVTIPNGLIAGFEVTIVTLSGVTLTVALGGSVVLFNNVGTTMAEKLSCTIKNRTTTNNYITAGSL